MTKRQKRNQKASKLRKRERKENKRGGGERRIKERARQEEGNKHIIFTEKRGE